VPFDKNCFRVFYPKKIYINILALETPAHHEPALCQLYRHTVVPYAQRAADAEQREFKVVKDANK